MWKKEAKTNLALLVKAGLPFTILGAAIVFSGIYILKQVFAENEYLVAILFVWLTIFWLIYQPLFKHHILQTKAKLKNN